MRAAAIPKSGSTQFLVFRLDGQELAIPAGVVREVIRVKGASLRTVIGRGSVRYELEAHGRSIPVVIPAPALGLPEKPIGPRSRLILLNHPDSAIVVDSVSRLENLPEHHVAEGKVKLGDKWKPIVEVSELVKQALSDGERLGVR